MYKIFVSDEFHTNTFIAGTSGDAMELFTMATRSGLYDYVSVSEVGEQEKFLREWRADNG